MRPFVLVTLLATAGWTALPAAQALQDRSADQERPIDQPPIFRLGVSLVQLDAVVTDKQGRHVTTLGPEDFEVFQNGKPQTVTAVSYVDAEERWEDLSGLPPLQSTRQIEDARHVFAIVVDDRRMSFESIATARRHLEKFVAQRFRSGEVAAMLLTTSGRDRFPSELTFSPTALTSAIRRLTYSPWTFGDISDQGDNDFAPPTIDLEQMYERGTSVTAIDRISEAVDTLGELPGRKSVVLVSEGFSVYGSTLENGPIREALQRLSDRANRAAVVLYAMDPRGLMAPRVMGAQPGSLAQRQEYDRRILETQWDLQIVSGQTGGFAIINSNDLVGGFERILADQRGYYLIGYQPEAGTVDDTATAFRKVKIKVKRKGLSVRTRSGFYGIATE
jgi:VWFA-related protein